MSTVKKTPTYHEIIRPDYHFETLRARFLLDAYKGGKGFIYHNTKLGRHFHGQLIPAQLQDLYNHIDVLPKYNKESGKSYNKRKHRANFLPFPKTVVNKIIRFIESKLGQVSVKNTGLETISDNIDRKKTPLIKFGIEALRRAIITGKATILIDSPHVETIPSYQDQLNGVRPFAVLLDPEQIEDFSKDEFGGYNWIKIRSTYCDNTDPLGDREPKTQWIFYYRDKYVVVRLDDKGKEYLTEYPYFVDGNRALSQVPIFEIEFEDSIIADIVDLSVRYMQIDSLTEEEFAVDLFPLWVFPESSKVVQEAENVSGQDDRIILDISETTGVTYSNNELPQVIKPSTDSVKSKMDYLLSIKKNISDLSGIDFINSETNWKFRSGESKRQDFIVTNANIVAYTKALAKTLTDILKFFAEIFGLPADDLDIQFPTEYNVTTLTDQINEIMLIESAGISDTYTREAKKAFVERNCEFISQDTYNKIINEIETSPASNTPAFNAWANSLQG